MKPERWIWIGGWGLPPDWLHKRAQSELPSAHHTVIVPGPTAVDAIDWGAFDRVGGYSLGAFLLLKEATKVPLPALLLAPFFAFPAEAVLGGKVRQAQVRFLQRWLSREPMNALEDFYRRANLGLAAPREIPYSFENLAWGLCQLADEGAPARLPPNWTGVIGEKDPLLDGPLLQKLEPRLRIVPGAGHHPAALMRAVSGK